MTLSARLAQQTGATILIAWGERLTWGRGYTVHVAPMEALLSDDLGRATEQINHAMESLIAQCPTQYLWAYDRYKQPRD
jgi:KDO2-lipid IV(A) lauroyltransferase